MTTTTTAKELSSPKPLLYLVQRAQFYYNTLSDSGEFHLSHNRDKQTDRAGKELSVQCPLVGWSFVSTDQNMPYKQRTTGGAKYARLTR